MQLMVLPQLDRNHSNALTISRRGGFELGPKQKSRWDVILFLPRDSIVTTEMISPKSSDPGWWFVKRSVSLLLVPKTLNLHHRHLRRWRP